jgi:hypothetical protein
MERAILLGLELLVIGHLSRGLFRLSLQVL